MSQQRWDVALVCLNGPLSGMGEQVFRGPVVRIGAEPGPGGFKLAGYRGLDKRHAVIQAYDHGTASIAPVGTNQVRMAPHAHVNWKEIEPMSGPEYLSEGCALHFGPVGRGATLEFVELRKLGVWQTGGLASVAASANVAQGDALGKKRNVPMAAGNPGAPPAAYDARQSTSLETSSVPIWFIGCMFLMSAAAVTTMAVIAIMIFVKPPPGLGPVEDGEDLYEFATIEAVDQNLLDGLGQGYLDFIAKPNSDAAGRQALAREDNFDEQFYTYVTASVQAHVKAWAVWRRLDSIREEYAFVLREMRDARLPDVFAAIPYQESRYRGDAVSQVCAAGYWQFMPEVAHRITKTGGVNMTVSDCSIKKGTQTVKWTPDAYAPPAGVLKNGIYMADEKCAIQSCRVDMRKELEPSTKGAIVALKEAWEDTTLANSGAAVQITISSHNAGYDDSRYQRPKKTNLLPAFKKYAKNHGKDEHHLFQGAMITTTTPHDKKWGGSLLPPEAQHYAYTIIAQHLIAVCYYGQNYSDMKEFAAYKKYTRENGFCTNLDVPEPAQVNRKGK